MLVDQIKKMRELLENKQSNRSQQKAVQGLEQFGKKANELLVSLNELADYYKASNADAILHESLLDLINRIESARATLIEGQETSRDYVQINETLNDIRTYLLDQWQVDVKQFQENEVLDKLRLAIFLVPTSRTEIGRKQQQFIKLLERQLPNQEDMNRIENLLEDLEHLASTSLPQMSSAIQQFLETLVVSRKARLSDISEEIWQWCEANNFLDKIDLKLGEPNDF